jgi:hypothetical protein
MFDWLQPLLTYSSNRLLLVLFSASCAADQGVLHKRFWGTMNAVREALLLL